MVEERKGKLEAVLKKIGEAREKEKQGESIIIQNTL